MSAEASLRKGQSVVKHNTILADLYQQAIHVDDLLLIDVSGSPEIIVDANTGRKNVVTDRKLLDSLLMHFKYTNVHKYLVVDLSLEHFEEKDESKLLAYAAFERTGFAMEGDTGRMVQGRMRKLPGGNVESRTINELWDFSNKISKSPLVNEHGVKFLPLVMDEVISGRTYQAVGPLLKGSDGFWYMNSIFFDPVIRPFHLMEEKQDGSKLFGLEEFLDFCFFNPRESIQRIRNKIVVVGNFKDDMHATIYNEMPGSLILLNFYASVAKNSHRIDVPWLIFLLIMFTLIVGQSFFQWNKNLHHRLENLRNGVNVMLLGNLIGAVSLPVVSALFLSTLSYFIFEKGVEVIPVTIVIAAIDTVSRNRWRNSFMKIETEKK